MYVLFAKVNTLNKNVRKYVEHIYCNADFLKRKKS